MIGYRIAPAAQVDFDKIWDYISADSRTAANRLLASFHDRLDRLVEFPMLGSLRNDLLPGLRSSRVGNYLLFYRQLGEGIELVRVIHGARDLPRLFEAETSDS